MDLERLNQRELAKLLGRTSRQIRNYLEQKDFPSHVDGGKRYYVWKEVRPWWEEELRRQERAQHEISPFEQARARKMMAQAKQEEMKAAREEKGLMPVSEHIDRLLHIAEQIRGKLTAVPGRWGTQLGDPKQTTPILQDAVKELLQDLSEMLRDSRA